MALEKELINGKGVKTTYHRIDSISMVDGIEVTVKSYTDESYRQQEKERESLIERQKEVKEQLEVMESAMREGCIGQLPEIYDGGNPSSSKGCFAQAWSVGEILRVYEAVK